MQTPRSLLHCAQVAFPQNLRVIALLPISHFLTRLRVVRLSTLLAHLMAALHPSSSFNLPIRLRLGIRESLI